LASFRLLIGASIVASTLSGCARPAEDRPYVATLQLRGVHNVSERALAHGLVSKPVPWWKPGPPHAFDELELARDRLRVQRYYEENGYYAAKVVLAEAQPGSRPRARKVVIAVEEGSATLIGDVRIMGLADVDSRTKAKAHKTQLGLRRGQVFHHADYEQFKGDVLHVLRKHGFANAKVSGLVDVVPTQNLANITVTANPSGAEPSAVPKDNAKPEPAEQARDVEEQK
jgi:outer membrane protein assembly factor BamA